MSISRNSKSSRSVNATFANLTNAALLESAVFLVSVGNPTHEGANLASMVWKFNSARAKHPHFDNLDVCIGGTLQRHNFWAFSQQLLDAPLKNLLEKIPSDIDLEKLAELLAQEFYEISRKVEKKYVNDNAEFYERGFRDINVKLICWHDEPAIKSNSSTRISDINLLDEEKCDQDLQDAKNYIKYYKLIKARYENREKRQLRLDYDETAYNYINKKITLITEQAKRIITLAPHLQPFFEDPIPLARICCRNYLMEECALIFGVYPFRYKCIFYPAEMSKAFKITNEYLGEITNKHITYIHIKLNEVTNGPGQSDELYWQNIEDQLRFDLKNFRISVYRKDGGVDVVEREKVSKRFVALTRIFSEEEILKLKHTLIKYPGNAQSRANIFGIVFEVCAFKFFQQKQLNSAIQCLEDAIFINDDYIVNGNKLISLLQQLASEENFNYFSNKELYIVNSLNVYEARVLAEVNIRSLPRDEYEECWLLYENKDPETFFYLCMCILIAMGDKCKAERYFEDALKYYKHAKNFAENDIQQSRLALNRIQEMEKIQAEEEKEDKSTSSQTNNVNFDFIAAAIANLKKEMSIYKKVMHVAERLASTPKEAILKKHEKIQLKVRAAGFPAPDYQYKGRVMNPAHAELFIEYAAFILQNDIYHPDAVQCYQDALYILNQFIEIWACLDLTEYTNMRDSVNNKIKQLDLDRKLVSSLVSVGGTAVANVKKLNMKYPDNMPPISHDLLLKFDKELERKENARMPELQSRESRRKVIVELVKETLNSLEEVQTNVILPYQFYLPLFKRIRDSKFIGAHDSPNWDYYLSINIPPFQQQLLALVTAAALKCFQRRAEYYYHDSKLTSDKTEKYNAICKEIQAAKQLPIFSLQTAGGLTMFKQTESPWIKELNKMQESYRMKTLGSERGFIDSVGHAVFGPHRGMALMEYAIT